MIKTSRGPSLKGKNKFSTMGGPLFYINIDYILHEYYMNITSIKKNCKTWGGP